MSIRARLTLYWAIVTAAILLGAGALTLALFARGAWLALDEALLEEADTIAPAIARATQPAAIALLRHLVAEKDLGPGRRVRLIVGGRVLLDAGDRATALPPGLPAPGAAGRVVSGRGSRFAEVPLRFAGEAAWLQDGVDSRPLGYTVARLGRTMMLLLPAILALSVAGGYGLAGLALRPIAATAAALARIGPGDRGSRLPPAPVRDEVGRLVGEINDLLGRLERASVAQQRFVAEAAHELRTPLTVLRSGLEVSLQRPRSAAESRAALVAALAEVERLCAIAEDLLALARLEAVKEAAAEPVDLGALVGALGARVAPLAAAKDQRLTVRAAAGVVVSGNRSDLQRVMLNLLDNAIKFTGAGGAIEIAAAVADGWALVTVSDDGPGIPAEEVERVFDPFYRSRRAGAGGGGLGLAVCREIVAAHRGEISAANRPGGGCAIALRLPLAAVSAAAS